MLPQAQLEFCRKLMHDLILMETLTVLKGLLCESFNKIELVGYADASLKVFGCCIYFRLSGNKGTVSANLLSSKSRLAPKGKTLTISRLKLNSALLKSKSLSSQIDLDTLKDRFPQSVSFV